MKKLLSVFAVGAALLLLTGCCCDKNCPPKHQHTAQCSGSECSEEKKDHSQQTQTNAMDDTQNDHNKKKDDCQVQSQKISAR